MKYVPLVKCTELLTSVYRIPVAHVRARAALSNTVPTNPYRSAGRPEAIFVIERIIDIAARQFGYDRIDLRRRNIIPPSAQPYANPLGMTYDSGDYAKVMDRALTLSDWKGFAKRKRESRKNKKLRGIGLANYLEITSGAPRECGREKARGHSQFRRREQDCQRAAEPLREAESEQRFSPRGRGRQHEGVELRTVLGHALLLEFREALAEDNHQERAHGPAGSAFDQARELILSREEHLGRASPCYFDEDQHDNTDRDADNGCQQHHSAFDDRLEQQRQPLDAGAEDRRDDADHDRP